MRERDGVAGQFLGGTSASGAAYSDPHPRPRPHPPVRSSPRPLPRPCAVHLFVTERRGLAVFRRPSSLQRPSPTRTPTLTLVPTPKPTPLPTRPQYPKAAETASGTAVTINEQLETPGHCGVTPSACLPVHAACLPKAGGDASGRLEKLSLPMPNGTPFEWTAADGRNSAASSRN